MKIKRLKNRLCAIGLIVLLVLTLLSGVNIGQYKVAHAGFRNRLLVAMDNTTISSDMTLSSGDVVTVRFSKDYLYLVFPSGETYTFEGEYNEALNKREKLDTCFADEEEGLLHIVTSGGKYYCMDPSNGSYMKVYKNRTNGLYSPESGGYAYEVVVGKVKTVDLYMEENTCTISSVCVARWMNRQEFDYLYNGSYDPSDIVPFTDAEIITGGNGTVEGTLSNSDGVKVVLEDYNLSVTVADASYAYGSLPQKIMVAFLDVAEELVHAICKDTNQYMCIDLRTGKCFAVCNDTKTGQYCTQSSENAVQTEVSEFWQPSKAIIHYLSPSSDDEIVHRLMTRYEYNQLNAGISPCDGTVYYDQGQITYNRGTKRQILCLQDFAALNEYGLDEYGTVWFMSRDGSVYWYNEKIADEVESLGGTLDSRQLKKNGNSVSAFDFCWNDSNSVIIGYCDKSTLAIEELPSYDELREMLGLANQPTEAPSSDPYATTEPTATVTPVRTPVPLPGYTSTPTMMPTNLPANTPTPSDGASFDRPTATSPGNTTSTPVSGSEGDVYSNKRIPAIASASSIKKTYGTKMFLLNVTTDSDGEVMYQSSNKKVVTVNGYGTVKIKGYGNAAIIVKTAETGKFKSTSKTIKISIVPEKLKNFKAKSKSPGKITFTWKKQNLKNAKCQIQASSSSKFTGTRSVKPSPKLKKGKYVADGLKRGSAYYFRARIVLKVSGKTYYSDWVKKKARIK